MRDFAQLNFKLFYDLGIWLWVRWEDGVWFWKETQVDAVAEVTLWLLYGKQIEMGSSLSDAKSSRRLWLHKGYWLMPSARETLTELKKCVGGIGRSIYFVFYYIVNYVSWWSKHTCTYTHFELEKDSIFVPICIDTKRALGKYFISLFSSYVLVSHRCPSS